MIGIYQGIVIKTITGIARGFKLENTIGELGGVHRNIHKKVWVVLGDK